MNTTEDSERFKHLPEKVRKAVCSGKGVTLKGLSGYNAYSNRTSYVELLHTDGHWFLTTSDEGGNTVSREEIDNTRAQNLLCTINLYPKPYWSLGGIGISSVEEVEKIYSAQKYSSYKDKPKGFGGIAETLYHTDDGRWFLLTVVDDDTDPSRTLCFWNTLTEEAGKKWLEAHKK